MDYCTHKSAIQQLFPSNIHNDFYAQHLTNRKLLSSGVFMGIDRVSMVELDYRDTVVLNMQIGCNQRQYGESMLCLGKKS
jgi:hypothetical protein